MFVAPVVATRTLAGSAREKTGLDEPGILYDVDSAHEDVYGFHCLNRKKFFKASLPSTGVMSNEPCLPGDDEAAAYTTRIDTLQDGYDANCKKWRSILPRPRSPAMSFHVADRGDISVTYVGKRAW